MSELIENNRRKKELLKHLMLQVHKGEAPAAVRKQLSRIMGDVPYDTVVEVEQELLADGLPSTEILKFCDIHTEVLKGKISRPEEKPLPAGHPAHTFRKENEAVQWELDSLAKLFEEVGELSGHDSATEIMDQVKMRLYSLADVVKHYDRKENLLFPYLEKHGITGPSKVMWAKDDEVRELVKAAIDGLQHLEDTSAGEALAFVDLLLRPAKDAIEDMIYREEQILIPMSLDTLSDDEWFSIYGQSPEYGFCLYDPTHDWAPDEIELEILQESSGRIQLPSGSLASEEINAILNTIPFDLTFVDNDDRVRYFTQGRERIFARSRAILGREVQLCHPPSSVHIVEQIIEDFRSGKQSRAPFWIELGGKFIHIEYFALRDKDGQYLGTLEVSQDLTGKRKLEGEQRLLSYVEEKSGD